MLWILLMHPAPLAEKIGTLLAAFLPGPLLYFLLFVCFCDFSIFLVNGWVRVLRPQPPRPKFSAFFNSSSGCWSVSSLVAFFLGGGENPPGSGYMGSLVFSHTSRQTDIGPGLAGKSCDGLPGLVQPVYVPGIQYNRANYSRPGDSPSPPTSFFIQGLTLLLRD